MEQAAKRQDPRGDEGEKQHSTPAPPAEPEAPFSLLQELPGPLMRQLVQRHLDAKDCLALLRTSHALARAVVQHRTHQQRRALTWRWPSRKLEGSKEYSSMDALQAATAASLLVRWAPAELRVVLSGITRDKVGTASISLPAALLPLIISLRLKKMHLTPATMDSLQQCQRLHTLDVARCSFPTAPPPARTLPALPLLRTFRFKGGFSGGKPWAMRDLGALCALATEVRVSQRVEQWAPHLPNVTRWDVGSHELDSPRLQALLQVPSVRHVQALDLSLDEDHSQLPCQWETLTVGCLDELDQLLLLPSGIGRLVLKEFDCLEIEQQLEHVEAVLQRWGAGRLQAGVDTPPHDEEVERWCLGAEGARGGFFELPVPSAEDVTALAALLRSTVLPQGGGPRTLALGDDWDESSAAQVMQHLAPLLAGTRVRTLCLCLEDHGEPVHGDVLSALPASVMSVHLTVRSVEQAREVLSGPAAMHALRVVVVLPRGGQGVEGLRELCAAHQPLVQLEVVRRG